MFHCAIVLVVEATEFCLRGGGLLTSISLKTDMSDIVSGSLMHDFNLECVLWAIMTSQLFVTL